MNGLEPTRWRKSSHSDHQGGSCVEVADLPTAIAIRDSKNPNGPRLTFSHSVFLSFTQQIRSRPYDLS
ncbi:DUF397 domain-containing protein [Actinocorallia aurantiaca]|uniref:DUF397 domain-containing protein n=1 Tax=Actinocorallia aurantiaca TaxID=46204 RepID=UPI0031E0610E